MGASESGHFGNALRRNIGCRNQMYRITDSHIVQISAKSHSYRFIENSRQIVFIVAEIGGYLFYRQIFGEMLVHTGKHFTHYGRRSPSSEFPFGKTEKFYRPAENKIRIAFYQKLIAGFGYIFESVDEPSYIRFSFY